MKKVIIGISIILCSCSHRVGNMIIEPGRCVLRKCSPGIPYPRTGGLTLEDYQTVFVTDSTSISFDMDEPTYYGRFREEDRVMILYYNKANRKGKIVNQEVIAINRR